ncbi:hypothetical protein [Micromonospora sp. NPDC049891]|uniref:hypothetical protein n=1 Tax=Micromonospora sp. NPDC049891 TaxID=3155655 RepID=UPI003410E972
MARYRFGGGIADWGFGTVTVDGTDHIAQVSAGVAVTFWSDEQGGTQYTDLLDSDSLPVTSVSLADGTGVRARGQIPPLFGPDGVTRMWAQAGTNPRALMVTTDAADITTDPGTILPPLSLSGTVTVGTGVHRLYNDTTVVLRVAGVRASVGTPSSSGSVVVDVNRNGTTIFPTQANRPAIASGSSTSGKNTLAEVTELGVNDYLTVDVDSAGTGAANLVVQILVTRS